MGEDDTPLEVGLGFAVALDKEGGFVGHEALVRQKEIGVLDSRLVHVRLPEATLEGGPHLLRNEPILREDSIVGYVTSGAWGFRLGESLGLAFMRNKDGVTAQWLREGRFAVEVAGIRHRIEAQLGGFYDPRGERQRG
jgi:glycine cleavage system aminomethyltransferase T